MKKKRKKKEMGVCQYCGSEMSVFNKFYDVYTCKKCSKN